MGSVNYLTPKEKKTVDKFVSKLKKIFGKDLIKLKLFGSKINGEHNKDSDIDIFIVLKNYLRTDDKVIDILYDIDPYFDAKISPVVYSEYEFKKNIKMESPFFLNVENVGIDL